MICINVRKLKLKKRQNINLLKVLCAVVQGCHQVAIKLFGVTKFN